MRHTTGPLEISKKLKVPEFLSDLFHISCRVNCTVGPIKVVIPVWYLVKGKGDHDPSSHHVYKLTVYILL